MPTETISDTTKKVMSLSEDLYKYAGRMVKVVKTLHLIEKLSSQEGDTVTIAHANPNFFGPNYKIYCYGSWVEWKDKSFVGDTLLECLQKAVNEKEQG